MKSRDLPLHRSENLRSFSSPRLRYYRRITAPGRYVNLLTSFTRKTTVCIEKINVSKFREKESFRMIKLYLNLLNETKLKKSCSQTSKVSNVDECYTLFPNHKKCGLHTALIIRNFFILMCSGSSVFSGRPAIPR